MKRALLVTAGTLAGTAAVLGYQPSMFASSPALASTSVDATSVDVSAAPVLTARDGDFDDDDVEVEGVEVEDGDDDVLSAPLTAVPTGSAAPTQAAVVASVAKVKNPKPKASKVTKPSKVKKPTLAAKPTKTAASAQPAAPVAQSGGTFKASTSTQFGAVTVSVDVANGKITGVSASQNAQDRKSQQIASYALPQLKQEALAAQSASVQGISGASYTSAGFKKSLQSALQQAGM